MQILRSRKSLHQPAATVLVDLKKGDKDKRNDFVWSYQDRVYAVAFMATNNPEDACELTIAAFHNAFASLRTVNPKSVSVSIWDWLVDFVIDACAEYHSKYSQQPTASPRTDPSADGSAQMDWETTVILGIQRVRRCLSSLPEEQQKVFLLRHQLELNYEQMAVVLNQTTETIMAWLFRARVQIVKCLGRG